MGLFTRVRDVINSNLNALLEKAEDPEKLLKLMTSEIEETLLELKKHCAQVMAAQTRLERQAAAESKQAGTWEQRARLAVSKGRDALAKEALWERKRIQDKLDATLREAAGVDDMVRQYKSDIVALEEKLTTAHDKQRELARRHTQAVVRKRAQEDIRRFDVSDAMARFDAMEERILREEAEADLVGFGRKRTLEDEFDALLKEDDIEKELQALKDEVRGSSGQ